MDKNKNIASIYAPDFVPFYIDIVRDYELTILEGLVYGFVHFHTKNAPDHIYINNTKLAEIFNRSEGHISEVVTSLLRKNLLSAKFITSSNGGTYRLLSAKKTGNYNTAHQENNGLRKNPISEKSEVTITNNLNAKPLTGNGITVNSKPLTDNPHTTPTDTPDSKHAIVPLTQMDKYTMAKELGVAFPVVVETEKRFWEYIEEPKNRKKYKTSYKTIRKWIEMKLEKGELSPANEVEILDIERHHPDEVAKLQKALEILKKQGRI